MQRGNKKNKVEEIRNTQWSEKIMMNEEEKTLKKKIKQKIIRKKND